MKRIALLMVAVVVVGIFGLVPASADHACDSTVVDGAGAVYVVVDNLENEHGGIWIYEESNGQAGLQRNDDSCLGDPDVVADTIIF